MAAALGEIYLVSSAYLSGCVFVCSFLVNLQVFITIQMQQDRKKQPNNPISLVLVGLVLVTSRYLTQYDITVFRSDSGGEGISILLQLVHTK